MAEGGGLAQRRAESTRLPVPEEEEERESYETEGGYDSEVPGPSGYSAQSEPGTSTAVAKPEKKAKSVSFHSGTSLPMERKISSGELQKYQCTPEKEIENAEEKEIRNWHMHCKECLHGPWEWAK